MGAKEILNKYGIDIEDLKKLKLDISNEVIESGKVIAEKFVPVLWNVLFENFKESIDANNYESAYSSDVFKIILGLCRKENISVLKRGTVVFRARIVDTDDLYSEKKGICIKEGRLNGYNWANSKEPPIGLSPEGRANSKYSSYFYCSEDGNTAASEVKPNINEYVSLAKFKTKRNLKLIELSEKEGLNDFDSKEDFYKQALVRYFSVPVKNAIEYKFTQFISDEIRKCGIDGICYKSYLTNSYNYVIFNCSMNTLGFLESKILRLHSQQLHFVDFSLEKVLSTKCDKNISTEKILKEKLYISSFMEQNRMIFNNDKLEEN